jgi:hypothetical protein
MLATLPFSRTHVATGVLVGASAVTKEVNLVFCMPPESQAGHLISSAGIAERTTSKKHTPIVLLVRDTCLVLCGGVLDKHGKKVIEQVCGKFLFLGQVVDSSLRCPISAIPSQAAKPTEDTMEQTLQLLDYIATQEEAVLTYSTSDMKLAVHSDASYLSEPQARSRAGGHFFLSNEATIPANSGAVLNIAHIIKHGMTSATKAELAALYIMAQEEVYIRIVLTDMGHK